MATWYVWDDNSHGIAGVFLVCMMTEADLAEEQREMTEAQIASVGPDHILTGTAADVAAWLQTNGCTEVDTDNAELRVITGWTEK